MSHRLIIVDVFAEEKYAGNQLAVVLSAGDLDTPTMQRIARETNFSETTFVTEDAPLRDGWPVRIFTPAEEIPFAGHPTIGTARVIRHTLSAGAPATVQLRLGIGEVPVRFEDDDRGEVGWMSTGAPGFGEIYEPDQVADLLGLETSDIDTGTPIEAVTLGVPFTFIPIRSLDAMGRAKFRSEHWESARRHGFPGCLFLFSRETCSRENQIHARMFATPLGITEDPATGSANACLGAYLLRHGGSGTETVEVRVEQGIEIGRPSLLRVRARSRNDEITVEVGGRVIETVRGEIY